MLQEWLLARWKQEAIRSVVVYVVRMLLGVAARGALFSYVPEVHAAPPSLCPRLKCHSR